MLRADIKRLIDASKNSDEAAKFVCQHLENELELHGNGWFDNDPVLEPLFSKTDDPAIEAASEELFEAVESILSPQNV
jgi:hypothetical protein